MSDSLPWRPAKQKRSQETTAAILTAADRVLREEDRERLTMKKVAAVAGVAPGTLYQYFPDKDALLRAVEEASWLEVGAEAAAAIQRSIGQDPGVAIEAVTRAAFTAILARRHRHGMTVLDETTRALRNERIEKIVELGVAALTPDRAQWRLDDLRFAIRIAVKTTFMLTLLAEDHPTEVASGAFPDAIATMIASFLLLDRPRDPET